MRRLTPNERATVPRSCRYAAAARTALAGAGLALASAVVVVWQTAHVAVLLDLSYVLNNAYRIASGDVPYRDFPLPYPPLTLVVQSSLIRLFGTHYLVHAAYSVILDAASTALTYWIVVRVVRDRWMATVLCLPLVVLGVQDIYPHPFYDPDATFLMLAVIGAAFWASNTEGNTRWATVGALLPVPILVKQNTGLAFFALMLLAVASTLVRRRPRALMALAAGALATFAVGSLILQLTAGLDNVARWTVTFAAGRLSTSAPPLGWLANPAALGFATLSLAGYAALRLLRGRTAIAVAAIAITYPYVLVTLLSFIAPERAPILAVWPLAAVLSCIAGTVSMMRGDGGFAPLLPFVCVGVATASFLSQDVYGSSYALWPLLVIACAVPARHLLDGPHLSRMVARIALPSIGALVLTAGAAYTLGESRLAFLKLEGAVERSTYPSLAGLAAPGQFLPELDSALRTVAELIPERDAMVVYPGEDPVFFALSRRPGYPVVQFGTTTNPYSPVELRSLRDSEEVRWVLVKRTLQIRDASGSSAAEASALIEGFDLVSVAGPYDVYRRR